MKISGIVVIMFVSLSVSLSIDSNKIIGGRFAKAGEFPFIVHVQRFAGTPTCGGSIISPYYVLSACHCIAANASRSVISVKSWQFSRVVAGNVLRFPSKGFYAQVRWIFRWIPHELCASDGGFWAYDFSVIQVTHPFFFQRHVKPIDLFSLSAENLEKKVEEIIERKIKCNVVGWGVTMSSRRRYLNPSPYLKVVDVIVQNQTECTQRAFVPIDEEYFDPLFYARLNYLTARAQLCAVTVRSSDSPCIGDSGSSLVCLGHLVGVVSSGINCVDSGFPGFYARMSSAVDFFAKYKNAGPVPFPASPHRGRSGLKEASVHLPEVEDNKDD